MSLSRFLASLLLLLAFCCRTTLEQPWISPPPSPPSPNPGRVLPEAEVDAVNSLLRLSRIPTANTHVKFSSNGCDSHQFRYTIKCNCSTCNCSSTRCTVTGIDLSGHILMGRIPDAIGNLTQLISLDLRNNRLYGTIPPSFVKLSQLSDLYLGYNNLEGNLSLLSEMKSLQSLYLGGNQFTGSIPPEFGSLPSLKYLSISNNLLSGNIPIELGNISGLIGLYLYDNLLTNQLPPHLGNLSNLEDMLLMNNEFSGALPSEFGKLERISKFNIRGNNINGTIPGFIGNWQRLQMLSLMGNNFEGPLPSNISALRNLTYLEVNNLPGSSGGSLFPNIANAKRLEFLTLRNCSLTDKIPDYVWTLPDLRYLDLSFNSLTGEIPAVVTQKFLRHIFLRRNKLSGSLPGWMLNATEFVDVSENLFSNTAISGDISSDEKNLFECYSNISHVHKKWQEVDYHCANEKPKYDHLYINCGGNQTRINGSVYEADLNPNGASTFNLSSSGAWAYSSMGIFMDSRGKEKYLANETSNFFAQDASLYMTARWRNTGKARDSSKKRRRVFDVEIQGQKVLTDFNIEEEAGGILKGVTKEFSNIPVNSSKLEIHLYWSGKGSTTSTTSYYGPLISAISVSPVPKKPRKPYPAIISASVGSVLLASLAITGLGWQLGWLGGEQLDDLDYNQIKDATNGFANKLGEGGSGTVYQGMLPNGDEISVKELSGRIQEVREIINKMSTIYKLLRHPNIVRLRGCHAKKRQAKKCQLLLVYEYMENNSLGDILFGTDQNVKAKLDWERRVKICLDVAKGLAYLHEECDLELIHGNIKPTTILLDKDFNAKISDIGFVQPDEKGTTRQNARPDERETTPVNTQVKGTQGYIAPECMIAKNSPKVDVYSFGILTLEIISGKPNYTTSSKGQTVYLLDMAYDYQRKGNLIALVDPSLESNYEHREALKILHLAMRCISPAPKFRPTMSEVVQILEGKKNIDNDLGPVAVSPSSHSARTSLMGTSDSTIPVSTSKEIDESSPSAHSDEGAES